MDTRDPLPKGDDLIEVIHKTVDLYAKGGGFYTNIRNGSQEELWTAVHELFCYSREYYEQ